MLIGPVATPGALEITESETFVLPEGPWFRHIRVHLGHHNQHIISMLMAAKCMITDTGHVVKHAGILLGTMVIIEEKFMKF